MKIDRNNYETFFIDYLDGNLSIGEIDLLLDFLNENPDLTEELKDLEKIKIQPSALSNSNYQHLKKSDLDLPDIFEETCIRAVENDLTNNELQNFYEYLRQNEDHQNIFKLFRLTVYEPDALIIYDQKNRLKKKVTLNFFKYWYSAAAIFILGSMLFIPTDQVPTVQYVVQVTKFDEIKDSTPVEVKREIETNTILPSVEKHSLITKCEKIQEFMTGKTRTKDFIEPMKPLISGVQTDQIINENMKLALVEKGKMLSEKDYSKYLTIKEFIAQTINRHENKGFIEKVALNILKKVSSEKFDYTTTNKGKIKNLEFNSPLIAFSIPLNTSKN
jgi:hypothetical protein